VLPLFNSATGHAFLGFMSEDEVAGVVADGQPAPPESGIAAIRRQVRAKMSASVDELLIPGLRATAVPILDLQGRAVLVATMMATSAFPRADDEAILRTLQDTCRHRTQHHGGAWPPDMTAETGATR
jgi:DNA-binding IclR family transcriptional regulator